MKFTIAVRTYNRPDLLKEALLSIYFQTHINWEVLVFDDAGDNFEIYKKFNELVPNNNVKYITTQTPYDLFKQSWNDAVNLASGEILVRLDDDDLLHPTALERLNKIYKTYSELDFTLGSSIKFDGDVLSDILQLHAPHKTFTNAAWLPYLVQDGLLVDEQSHWYLDFYNKNVAFTSLIHLSRMNWLSVWHLYTMRVRSLKPIIDEIKITSNKCDDLEFFGILDYKGLTYSILNDVFCFYRLGGAIAGTQFHGEIERVRTYVDSYRPSGFTTSCIDIDWNMSSYTDIETSFKYLQNQIDNFKLKLK